MIKRTTFLIDTIYAYFNLFFTWIAYIIFRLPIETSEGTEVIAEGTCSNKKDAVLACALDACRLIQAYNMMQNTTKGNISHEF